MKNLNASYNSYVKHYAQYSAKYGMDDPLLSKQSYADAYRLYQESHSKSQMSNIPRDIAKTQIAVSYRESLEIANRAKSAGQNIRAAELRKFKSTTYEYKGVKHIGTVRQALYFHLLNTYGTDFADESFGY